MVPSLVHNFTIYLVTNMVFIISRAAPCTLKAMVRQNVHVKALLNKASDPSMEMLVYRSTPLQCEFSLAELLMSRKLRTNLPLVRKERIPKVPDIKVVRQKDNHAKTRQKKNFNSHHGVYELPELYSGDMVWIKDRQTEGKVIQEMAPDHT